MNVLAPLFVLLGAAAASRAPAAQDATPVTIWPGYTFGLPAGHCVEQKNGPDFHVFYLHDPNMTKSPILIGVYGGHAPRDPDCGAQATKKRWDSNGLSIQSARAGDGCAEFLFQDAKKPERGFLHVWFGPAARNHPDRAEALIGSVRPAPLPDFVPTDLRRCP